jgi:SM-20-related protein
MPSAGFFRQAGLFVVSNFLEEQLIADIRREMETAPKEKGLVLKAGGVDSDENTRKVEVTVPPKEIRTLLKARMLSLTQDLEQHFKLRLAGYESPQYLIYQPGSFFKAHSDRAYAAGNAEIAKRRVSAVIFLNRESEEPMQGTYGQGRLTFYGLLDGPRWERCGIAVNPEPGLLVAFPSDKVHEVTPVSHGQRLTIVTWFYAPDEVSKSEVAESVASAQTLQGA